MVRGVGPENSIRPSNTPLCPCAASSWWKDTQLVSLAWLLGIPFSHKRKEILTPRKRLESVMPSEISRVEKGGIAYMKNLVE